MVSQKLAFQKEIGTSVDDGKGHAIDQTLPNLNSGGYLTIKLQGGIFLVSSSQPKCQDTFAFLPQRKPTLIQSPELFYASPHYQLMFPFHCKVTLTAMSDVNNLFVLTLFRCSIFSDWQVNDWSTVLPRKENDNSHTSAAK